MADKIEDKIIGANAFRRKLKHWHSGIDRPMPWKQTKDAYRIWLSEIILQQTTVAQGTPYFLAFEAAYPTVKDLAQASLDQVLRLWQGLGYYARARNMHASAKHIVHSFNGTFPNTYQDIAALKGIGPYTAAAIASFAFDLPCAVVDGNVIRVLSRIFGIIDIVSNNNTKKKIAILATHLLDNKQPGEHNQAIMDFGAIQCTAHKPDCNLCPFQKNCYAFINDLVDVIPVKKIKTPKKNRYMYFILFTNAAWVLLHKRTDKDIWNGLHTFPIIEENKPLSIKKVHILISEKYVVPITAFKPELLLLHNQKLTHQNINGFFYKVTLSKKALQSIVKENYTLVQHSEIRQKAMPKIMLAFLDKYYL